MDEKGKQKYTQLYQDEQKNDRRYIYGLLSPLHKPKKKKRSKIPLLLNSCLFNQSSSQQEMAQARLKINSFNYGAKTKEIVMKQEVCEFDFGKEKVDIAQLVLMMVNFQEVVQKQKTLNEKLVLKLEQNKQREDLNKTRKMNYKKKIPAFWVFQGEQDRQIRQLAEREQDKEEKVPNNQMELEQCKMRSKILQKQKQYIKIQQELKKTMLQLQEQLFMQRKRPEFLRLKHQS